jgi:hypothetical protein
MFKIRWGEVVRGEPLVALPHQTEFLERFRSCRGVIGCFDEPGLGKSLEIMMAIEQSLNEGEKALIVMPPHLLENWKQELNDFTYFKVGKDVDLVPYTMLGKKISSFAGYKLVADDEGHYLKNLGAQRTMKFMDFLERDRPDFFIHATGTPIGNRIPEIYPFLLMLSGFEHVSPKIDVKYPTYYQFCERFCHVKNVSYGSGIKYHGMKNVDELKEYLKPWTIRRKTDEVLTLPEMENQRVVVSYKEDPALAKAWEEYASNGEFGGVDIKAKKEAAIAKAPFTAKWVADELEQEAGPIVIFSDHREPAKMIHEALRKEYMGGLIIGGQDMGDRDALKVAFQNGELDYIVLTSAGFTGITLTESNLIVGNDLPWKPDDLDQVRRRIRRISQKRKQRCVYMVGSRADDQITQMLVAKLKVINAVVEN